MTWGDFLEWICSKRKFVMKIFFTDKTEWSSQNLWKMISADVKANKSNKKYRSGSSILQIFIKRTFKTRNTSPNNVKNFKKYSLLTLTTYFDTTFTVHSFIKSSVTFWYGVPVGHAQSFRAGRQQKLLIFVPNTVNIFKIPWYCLFL